MKIRDAGDRALVVEFGDVIDPGLVARVRQLDQRVHAALSSDPEGPLAGVVETVPTFRSLALVLDPLRTSPDTVAEALAALVDDAIDADLTATRSWELPVNYGGDNGPDLDDVARHSGLDREEVIARHVDLAVSVYLLGFMPGFAFLGNTDPALHLPRRTEPRVRVPAGSVGLALTLTAIYPWQSPGGWHLIGHSPVPLFDADRSPAALLSPGDRVYFKAVEDDEHAHLLDAVQHGQIAADAWLKGTAL